MRHITFTTSWALLLILTAPQTSLPEEGILQKEPVSSSSSARRLEPDRLLSSGGIGIKTSNEVLLEPNFGISHVIHQREIGIGYDDIIHRVHAQAGGKVNLFENFYLGISSKLPIYNYEIATGRSSGGPAIYPTTGRHDYELLRLSPANLTWTGEMGFRLGKQIDLNLYYDQNRLNGRLQPGLTSEEEVIGSRFIIRFK